MHSTSYSKRKASGMCQFSLIPGTISKDNMSETIPTPGQKESKKEQWLAELTKFLSESYQHGWAAGAEKAKDPETGEKTLIYERGEWKSIDRYTGYFAAPGETKIFYKGRHAWSMQYGGEGQRPKYYREVQQTYAFLKEALQAFNPELPVRGPEYYRGEDGEWQYSFTVEGDIENGIWREKIDKWTGYPGEAELFFSQNGTCGIIIDKDADHNPVYPWD